MKRLENKVAVITGGASGIGLATAKEFKKEGAKVVLFDVNAARLAEASAFFNGDVLTVQGDVRSHTELVDLFEQTKAKYGKVDVLFANAGLASVAPIEQVTEAMYDEMMDVNVKGAYFTVQKALPYLNAPASVIFTSSISGHMGQHSLSVYAMTKLALRSLAKTLSAELVSRGVRVNVVSPGFFHTAGYDRLGIPEEAIKAMLDGAASQNMSGRIGQLEEVARAVVYLASPESSYTVGTELIVDGGHSIVR